MFGWSAQSGMFFGVWSKTKVFGGWRKWDLINESLIDRERLLGTK